MQTTRRRTTRRALFAASLAVCLALPVWLTVPAALAQQDNGDPRTDEARVRPDIREMVFTYLDTAPFIRPGVGVGNIVIGMPLTAVVALWGQPSQSDRSGFFHRRSTLLYDGGINAWVRLVGDRTVEEIGIEGRTGLTTREGVGYGTTRHQVRTIYGEPVEDDTGTYRYPERGIAFVFRSGTVFQIELFSPEQRESD
jgi:hypothetical protein